MPSPLRKAIFLAQENPYLRSTGRQIRDTYLIQLLRESLELELFHFPVPDSASGLATPAAQWLAGRAETPGNVVELPAPKVPLWKKTLFPLLPREVGAYSPEVEQLIRGRSGEAGGTLLWFSGLGMAQYVPLARSLGYRTVLDEYRVENPVLVGEIFTQGQTVPAALRTAQRRFFESRFCRQSHAVVTTSDLDASRIQRIAPGSPVHVIPNSVEFAAYESLRAATASRDTLLFPGALDSPSNLEGLRWFVAEVLPRLRSVLGPRLPRLVAAGHNPSRETIASLERAGVEVRANPPSMMPLLAEASLAFFPIRSHAAMRFRILEAMAAGKAVVASGKAAEGLLLSPSYDIWIADRADAFTSALVKLIEDPALRQQFGERASRTVETRYDWRQVRRLLENLLASISGSVAPEGTGE